ncbi:MAG: DsbA family protein [Janthinobacterium lividum]
MSRNISRFFNFILLGIFLVSENFASSPQPHPSFMGELPKDSYELIWGSESAPVTVVEYTSLSCGHCADFHKNVLPEIRKKYIDTGRVRFVFRHFPIDRLSLKISTLVNDLPYLKRSYAIDQIFDQQDGWIDAGDKAFEKIAVICQIPLDKYQQIINDKEKLDAAAQSRFNIEKCVSIEGTPTFFINDKMYPTALSLAQFEQIVLPKLQTLSKP